MSHHLLNRLMQPLHLGDNGTTAELAIAATAPLITLGSCIQWLQEIPSVNSVPQAEGVPCVALQI